MREKSIIIGLVIKRSYFIHHANFGERVNNRSIRNRSNFLIFDRFSDRPDGQPGQKPILDRCKLVDTYARQLPDHSQPGRNNAFFEAETKAVVDMSQVHAFCICLCFFMLEREYRI